MAQTTTVANRNISLGTPQIHLLVIGVGEYQHLAGGTDPKTGLPNLSQLTSPPISAVALAQRLYKDLKAGPLVVGTVEMVLSSAQTVDIGDGPRDVKEATRDQIDTAFNNWLRRCDGNRNNVALFYFCGHGMRLTDMLLLPSDFGSNPNNVMQKAINFSGTYVSMAKCLAATQIYLLDACGTWDNQFNLALGQYGTPLLDITPQELQAALPRCAPIIYASENNQPAFSNVHATQTPFVDLLTKAIFDGKCATRQSLNWNIKPGDLAKSLPVLAEWEQLHNTNVAMPTMSLQYYNVQADRAVHQLTAPPKVDIRFYCPQGTPGAVMFVEQQGFRHGKSQPLPGGVPWDISVPAGMYDIVVNDPGTNRDLSRMQDFFQPPPQTLFV